MKRWLPGLGSGIKEYEIFRGAEWRGTTTHTSFTDSGLTPDTSYTYTIRAIDFEGN
ncbi:fibronectin type III domain-containing protein [Paenibacillus sp. FSL A5-0031]|uniref:fibronectin type III domain-containing protein n=1 Tax=Paenibacillus sp. FSL A5-0031 TaxID=1920420 RepID=UPI001186ADD0|nr:fibronectin type III domain-containing protein [Paenibacillus sp. FSL A5-0031]